MVENKNILVVDSSQAVHYFCLFNQTTETAILSKTERGADTQFDQNFARLNQSPLDEIWIGKGPGSFTGLRVAFSYIRAWSLLGNVKLRLFHSSLLWRKLLQLRDVEWLLFPVNANLFYGDRFDPNREFYFDSPEAWSDKLKENVQKVALLNSSEKQKNECIRRFENEGIQTRALEYPAEAKKIFTTEDRSMQLKPTDAGSFLRLSEILSWRDIAPDYGLELSFKKQENHG